MLKFYLILLTAFSINNYAWESSGGGDAVVCFKDLKTALLFDEESNSGLSSNTRANIESVVTLEYWEYKDEPNLGGLNEENLKTILHYNEGLDHFFIRKENASAEDYLNDAKSLVKVQSPLFYQRLTIAHQLISESKWVDNRMLKPVNDSTPKKEISKNSPCRLVQLAVRKAVSEAGKIPSVHLEVDMDLFHRMTSLNQALLILHEEYYLLGREIGHINSDLLRFEVARMFSKSTHIKYIMFPPENPSEAASDFQYRLAKIYGDYINIFNTDPIFIDVINRHNSLQQSRQLSFISFIQKTTLARNECEKSGNATGMKCMDYVFQVMLPESKIILTDEESFVFIGRWFIDQLGFLIRTSENFLVWDIENPSFVDSSTENELIQTCRFISDLVNEDKEVIPALVKIRKFPFFKIFTNLFHQTTTYCNQNILN